MLLISLKADIDVLFKLKYKGLSAFYLNGNVSVYVVYLGHYLGQEMAVVKYLSNPIIFLQPKQRSCLIQADSTFRQIQTRFNIC